MEGGQWAALNGTVVPRMPHSVALEIVSALLGWVPMEVPPG
jgi:hypothetical protein